MKNSNISVSTTTTSPKIHESESASTTESHWMEDGVLVRAKGLNWVITGLFVVGDMAGGGLVALPTSMVRFGVIAGSHCGKPYPEMGFRAFGNCMRIIVSICIDVTQFGIAVVFLLLASKNIHDFLKATWNIEIHFCLLILAVALAFRKNTLKTKNILKPSVSF
uniref:Amino acid transporter transmembrane domain-containing protein n=1 Tax=Panagrolaimus sp. PS1159 TaxID=55785 RepID=A0AC35FNS6_9BILA